MNFSDYLIQKLGILKGIQAANGTGTEEYIKNIDELLKQVSIFDVANEKDLEDLDYNKLFKETDDVDGKNPVDSSMNKNVLETLIESLFQIDEVIKAADKNNDGEISSDEAENYINSVKNGDGTAEDFSMADIDKLMEDLDVDFDKLAKQALNDALLDIIKNPSEKQTPEDKKITPETSPSQSVDSASPAGSSNSGGGVSGGGGVAGGGGNYGASPSGASGASQPSQSSVSKEMTVEELEAEKTKKESVLSEKQEAVNDVHSGTNQAVSDAVDDAEEAQKLYEETLEKDDKVDKELKDKQAEISKDLSSKEKEISDKNIDINNKSSEISEHETTLTSQKSELSSLESSLSSLPQPSGKEEDAEKDKEIASKKASIEQQITAKKQEIESTEQKLETAKKDKTTLETELKTLETEKQKILTDKADNEAEILKTCSAETKEAMQKANEAKANVDTVKAAELEKANSEVTTAQKDVDDITAKLTEAKNKELEKENSVSTFDLDIDANLTDSQKAELEQIKKTFEEHKAEYEEVAKATGVPAELIAAIHYREGSMNFGTYLHNGEPLGKTTTKVPQGIYFDNWVDAAKDALSGEYNGGKTVDASDPNTYFEFAEAYNGYGYRNKGLNSPYVWAGTTKYTGGMYVADGQFSASAVDKRVGVAVILESLMT